jgi:two-component sensor histidine kinase
VEGSDVGAEEADARVTRRSVIWLWYWMGWTGLALFLGISSSLAYISVGNPPRWSLSIRMSLVETYGWALIAPGVMALARRFPFTRATLGRSLAVHVPASLVVSVFKVVADQILRWQLFGFRGYVLFTSLAPNVLFYWGIVAAAHGFAYYRSSREKELRASQLETRLAEARLQLLQMQLHPHFLFNTLHAVSELVHEDPDTADRMITGLSDLLREALAAGEVQEVPLGRELELLGKYLEIQQARFGDRLQVAVDVDPAARRAMVPHLILQPIVENAIKHGLGARVDDGAVRIQARAADDQLILEIQDDGPGVTKDADMREGVGLGNTRERLRGLYGHAHRVEIGERSGGGTVVRITIPLRFATSE